MLRIGVHDDILVPSSTAAHPAPLQGTGEAAGAKARVGEGQTALHGLQRQPWLEKRSRFARAQSHQMQQTIKDGVYICLKSVCAFYKLAKASCANLNSS